MQHESGGLLPKDAKGVRVGPIKMVHGIDKISIVPNDPNHRYLTIQFGNGESGLFDIHWTKVLGGPYKTHETVFETPRENLFPILRELGSEFETSLKKSYRSLRPGWMIHHQIGAIVGFPISRDKVEQVTKVEKKFLTIESMKVAELLHEPEFIEDLYALPDGEIFLLYSRRSRRKIRIIGWGFQTGASVGKPRLYWVKNEWVINAIRRCGEQMKNISAIFDKSGTCGR